MKVTCFIAKWSDDCKTMINTLNNLKSRYENVKFEILDVNEGNIELQKLHIIRSVPTTLIYRESNDTVERLVGVISESRLIESLNN